MDTIQVNQTKYSGLPLSALIHLIKTSAPVNQFLRREVWKELFYRYFTEGRTFNLYDLLKRNPQMFANTIGWELKRENVEVPVEHAEAFMQNLLEFIDYIDKHVLQSGVQFEWQLHELNGMKEMIERVRDAKVQDMTLRQKINLFIDKINQTRKDSLLLIEEAKQQQTKQESSVDNELIVVKDNTEIVVTKEKHELMKQELKRLSIPVSKMTKKQWTEAINNFEIYYEEDKKKLIKQGLRKYDFYDHRNVALLAFKLNLEFKIPNVSMSNLLFYSFNYYKQPTELFGSDENLYYVIKELYFSAVGATKEGWHEFSTSFLKKLNGDFSKQKLLKRTIQLMEEVYPIVKQYYGSTLSNTLQDKVMDIMEKGKVVKGIQYEKETGNWVVEEVDSKQTEVSVFEQIYKVLDYIRGYNKGHRVVQYDIETFSKSEIEISENVPYQYHQMIRDFCLFPSSLVFDAGVYNLIDKPYVNALLPDFFSRSRGRGEYLLYLLKHKYNSEKITDEELIFLYKTDEGQDVFKKITNRISAMQGWLKCASDFIGRFFDRTLNLFDFSKEEDRRLFFRLPFRIEDFFRGHGYTKKEYVEWIANKLREEAPHEYNLIAEYFSNINETYEDYKSYDAFEYLSDFERLVLEREGVQTGETIKHQGYKERDIYYSSEEAQNKFLVEYFQKYYE
ncbi:hypothetical protein CON36_32290 [Bacillus cereus]|uniref:Uncharacterized protein n=1 Tax=Bacillus cereus TaxID=1396 RepID=A0A9X6ST56_BACCE|nr:hypothetical protein [Bacillus cereus]PDZ94708.1 hypothetical protein CON36_32290 [Bacillus cereus]